MMKVTHVALFSLLCLPASAGSAKPEARSNVSVQTMPAECNPKPCVTLNAQELNVLGPIVGGRFQQLQQEYQALGSVIQDIKRQTAPKPETSQKK